MYIVGGIVLAVVFALIASQPQRWWRVTQGWAYRNPEANEPSAIAFGIQSVAGVVMAIVCLVGGFVVQHQHSEDDKRADECARVRQFVKRDPHADEVRRALQDAGYTVDDLGNDDYPALGVNHGDDEVATMIWSDGADENPQVTCS